MPARKPSALLAASLIVAASFACGCLENPPPIGSSLELSVLGAATMPAVWNTSGLVEPPQDHTFLLVELELHNKGTADISGVAAADFRLSSGDNAYVSNFLSGDVTVIDPCTPTNVTAMCATSLPSLMDSMSPGGSTQALLLFSVPAGLGGDAMLTCTNVTALGKGRTSKVALDWTDVRAFDRAPPRLGLRADHLQYLNRTAQGQQVPTRYLVANVTVTNGWSQPFVLALFALRLLDGGGQSHPAELDPPWLGGELAGGPLAPGASRSGQVAFALPPPAEPVRLMLDEVVPVAVGLDAAGIGYGK